MIFKFASSPEIPVFVDTIVPYLCADKINIGALGNLVPQLHVHHIARFRSDPAWPGPVWGHSDPLPYEKHSITERVGMACDWFGDGLEVF